MRHQLPDEFLRRRRGELAVEVEDEQMRHPEIANERDLVLRGGEQMRRFLRPQHLRRMRIEGDDDGRAAGFSRVARRSGNDRLMAEMNAVEDPDGEKERPGSGKFGSIETSRNANDE